MTVVVLTSPSGSFIETKLFTVIDLFLKWDPGTAVNCLVKGPQGLNVFNNVSDINIADVGVQCPLSAAKSSGKYYFEITVAELDSGSFDGGICIAPPGIAYDVLGAFAGGFNPAGTDGAGGVILEGNGNIFSDGNHICTLKGIATGDAIAVAVDLDSRNVWFQVVAGPNARPVWNGGLAGSGANNGIGAGSDPATGTLGVSLPAGAMVPYLIFGADNRLTDEFEANFGQNQPFIPPTGFTEWPVS